MYKYHKYPLCNANINFKKLLNIKFTLIKNRNSININIQLTLRPLFCDFGRRTDREKCQYVGLVSVIIDKCFLLLL
jgi:hypothetical protein